MEHAPGRGVEALRVRYAETDQMGRAHHAHYLVWCESGRTALMRERGVSYAALERRGIRLPVARASLEYRGAVGYDAIVRVETRVEAVRSRSVTFAYRILDEEGRLLARATTELVCTDDAGRPARLPEAVRDALDRAAEEARTSATDAASPDHEADRAPGGRKEGGRSRG